MRAVIFNYSLRIAANSLEGGNESVMPEREKRLNQGLVQAENTVSPARNIGIRVAREVCRSKQHKNEA